jgi:hypothetical protein
LRIGVDGGLLRPYRGAMETGRLRFRAIALLAAYALALNALLAAYAPIGAAAAHFTLLCSGLNIDPERQPADHQNADRMPLGDRDTACALACTALLGAAGLARSPILAVLAPPLGAVLRPDFDRAPPPPSVRAPYGARAPPA